MPDRRLFASTLLAATLCLPAVHAEEAPKTKLPLPWQAGRELVYATERVQTKTAPGKREKTVATDTTLIRVLEAGPAGSVQQWHSRDGRTEVLEGDPSQAAMIAEATAALEDLALVVELGADGSYQRMRNIEEVGKRMREAMRPLILQATRTGGAAADPAVAGRVDAFLANFTAPAVLEGVLTRHMQNYLNFLGVELEEGSWFELDTNLPNPTGAATFPAKLTFGLFPNEDEPEDVFLEWTLEIDRVKGAAAVRETASKLFGIGLDAKTLEEMPREISITDEGFLLIERATGIVEMYESERTTKFGTQANYERTRMRLAEGGHGHEWAEQAPQATEPSMTGVERERQACADDTLDTMAAIAACTALLDRADAAMDDRATWYAQRGGHRMRAGQAEEAAREFARAIAVRPADVALRLKHAWALGQGGDYAAAEAAAAEAARLDPASAEARFWLGSAIEMRGDLPRAREHYLRGAALAPDDARFPGALCWLQAIAGELAEAQASCDRALALDPGSANVFNSRGFVHFRAGRLAEAVADYDAAIAADPGVASSWYVRGLARRGLGEAAAGDADVAHGQELEPGVAERYAGYGVR
jgi:tetratricopeptide (TPR) repeat protein